MSTRWPKSAQIATMFEQNVVLATPPLVLTSATVNTESWFVIGRALGMQPYAASGFRCTIILVGRPRFELGTNGLKVIFAELYRVLLTKQAPYLQYYHFVSVR